MYEVIWSPKAYDGLSELDKETIRRIIEKIEQIKHTPFHFLERLSGNKCWKLRIGDYRAIIDLDEAKKELIILKVGHRRNIYKKT